MAGFELAAAEGPDEEPDETLFAWDAGAAGAPEADGAGVELVEAAGAFCAVGVGLPF